MPKLFSSRQVVKILEKNGFIFISQNGSHIKYRKYERKVLTVIVPANKKEIPVGTMHSIIRQSAISDRDFYI
ncbi:MAG: type II toxin-antitoxin system HicA family toxin [Patescibacteria group bacterium]